MSDISNFSDSDAGDLLNELDKLDDLDGNLFGDKNKKPSASSEEEKVKLETPNVEKKSVDDFNDDDDPLADLLSEETKQKTKRLLQKSIALAAQAEPKEVVASKTQLEKLESVLSPKKGDLGFLSNLPVSKKNAERSPKRQITKKEEVDFGDNDFLDDFGFDDKPKKLTKKVEVDFGDDDLLNDLGFDDKPKKKEVERRVENPVKIPDMKADVIFGDDDVLDDLGFGSGASKQKGREAEKPAGRRAVSFMDDLLDVGSDKKSSSEPKEFSLGERYKSPPTKGETDVGYNPSAGVRTEMPRRRRTVDDATSSTPALKKQQALESLFEDPPPIIPPTTTIASPERRPTIGRLPTTSSGADWLGGKAESSPKKNPQDNWLGGTVDSSPKKNRQSDWLSQPSKAKSMDWLGTSSVQDEITDKVADKEAGLDWLQLKKNLKSKENVAKDPVPELTRNVVSRDSGDAFPERTQQVASPKRAIPEVSENMSKQALTSTRETREMIANIQGLSASAQIEKEQLMNTIENLNERHKEELKSTETFYKNQLKMAEDLHKDTENRCRSELGTRIQDLQENITRLEKEKAELLLLQQEKGEKTERERKQEVDRLKEIHSQALLALRQEHQDSLGRLQRLKEQELHAMASVQVHNRSVQQVMTELEAKTMQLSSLQERLEGQHQEALEGRWAALEAKEQQLKALEVRHQRAHEESEEERSRLQQLVLRLEKRMVDQTRDLEEERWKVLQERGRLESRSQALEEKQADVEHQMVRDRNRLQQAKELCLEEQKGIWLQVAQERQVMSDRDALLRRKEENIQRIQNKRMQEEVRLESEQRHLQEERLRLVGEQARLREEEAALVREKEALQAIRDRLREEVDAAHATTALLKRRERELDLKDRSSTESREEGLMALATARQLEGSVREQQHKVVQQIQILHEKERKVMKERMAMLDELQRLENTRNSLICANCRLAYIRPLGAKIPPMNLSGHLSNNDAVQANYSPTLLKQVSEQPSLIIWKLLADKDKVFLQEEQRYLDSLNSLNNN